MAAKLMVQLVQARNLAAKDSNGLSDPFVRLQLGKTKARSTTVYKSLDPTWNEEFLFNARDMENDVLQITVWDEDMLGQADFLGQITLPVKVVAQAEGLRIPPTWFVLKKRSEKSRVFVSGEIRLGFALWGVKDTPEILTLDHASLRADPSSPSLHFDSGLLPSFSPSDSLTFPHSLSSSPPPPTPSLTSSNAVSWPAFAPAQQAVTAAASQATTFASQAVQEVNTKVTEGGSKVVGGVTAAAQSTAAGIAQAGNSIAQAGSNIKVSLPRPGSGISSLTLQSLMRPLTGGSSKQPSSASAAVALVPMSEEAERPTTAAAAVGAGGGDAYESSTVTMSAPLAGDMYSRVPFPQIPSTASAASDIDGATPNAAQSTAKFFRHLSRVSTSIAPTAQQLKYKLTTMKRRPNNSNKSGGLSSPSQSDSEASVKDPSLDGLSGDVSSGAGGGTASAAVPLTWFDRDLKDVPSKGSMPEPMAGGVVVNHKFACAPYELNSIIFRQDSDFWIEFTTVRKLSDLHTGPWLALPADGGRADGASGIQRTVTYMTAPSSLVKSVRATELMTHERADAGGYLVTVSVATPDVPYGNTFRTEMQFEITPLADGRPGSHLRVSWRPNFLQSTMMKSMIEGGMRSGIRDTYKQFVETLSKHAPLLEEAPSADLSQEASRKTWAGRLQWLLPYGMELVHLLSILVFAAALVVLPMHFSQQAMGRQGLVIPLVALPNSVWQLLWAGVLFFCSQTAILYLRRLALSRLIKKGDHGKKAEGTGWLLTVTIVQGENIGDAGLISKADPYVVFSCGGKLRMSSVKLQTMTPKWNEILEFDAFEEPPSTMEVEVFDYEGPFAEAHSLGHAEINFLKLSSSQLADMWVPLEGRKAMVQQSRVHLRVFLSNTTDRRSPEIVEKLRKEAGKKVPVISSAKNESFQRLFNLPDNEHLVADFTCAVKKTILLQGRMFLSLRLLAFYSNVFGHKVKTTVLWEDIEEMQENAQSISTLNRMLNPSITIYVKKGRGTLDVQRAAYGADPTGRLKIRFQTFVRPATAFRMIKALWKHRALPPEQQLAKVNQSAKISSKAAKDKNPAGGKDAGAAAAAATGSSSPITPSASSPATAAAAGTGAAAVSGGKDVAPHSPTHSTVSLHSSASTTTDSDFGQLDQLDLDDLPRAASQMLECDDSVFLGAGNSEVIETITMDLPLSVDQFLSFFENKELIQRIADSSGYMEMVAADWVAAEGAPAGSKRLQRNLRYKFNRQVCSFGATITAVQQATKDDLSQWATLEEFMTLLGVPFGDHFTMEMKREVRLIGPCKSELVATVAISWQKETSEGTKQKITSNVGAFYKTLLKNLVENIVKEVIAATQS